MATFHKRLSLFSAVIPTLLAIVSYSAIADTAKLKTDKAFDTLTVTETESVSSIIIDGQVEAIKAATVSAQTSGRIIQVNYDVNDVVTAGASLLEITSDEQTAEFNAAEAQLASSEAMNFEAQATLTRYAALFPQGAISQGQMDEATANAKSSKQAVSAAKAQLNKAKQSLNYTVVSAPFEGRVTERFIELGETISYGQPLFSGFDTRELRATFNVPSRYLANLQAAKQLELTLTNGEKVISNHINVYQFADANSHQHQVRVNFSHPQALTGQWVKIAVPVKTSNVVIIPLSALYQVNDLDGVYRKVGQHTLLTQIRLGKIDKQLQTVEVLSGLDKGDEIILNASRYVLLRAANQSKE
ncbi:efflux RND transporter periplasmic adaptor subunit [Shewanella sp. 10N.286.51.B2]|uniref:efflux RND transporter periplasmic adaptor subunit n=1 Tax=Shewanella sp. 10N.286.51.B2 TaxID=3229707 RepID=UPI003550698F